MGAAAIAPAHLFCDDKRSPADSAALAAAIRTAYGLLASQPMVSELYEVYLRIEFNAHLRGISELPGWRVGIAHHPASVAVVKGHGDVCLVGHLPDKLGHFLF
jgi:hypothetical protein